MQQISEMLTIDYRFAWIEKCDGYERSGTDLRAINPVYRLENGTSINESEFRKLQALLEPQGIFLCVIFPSNDE